jgi:hypothetical protein
LSSQNNGVRDQGIERRWGCVSAGGSRRAEWAILYINYVNSVCISALCQGTTRVPTGSGRVPQRILKTSFSPWRLNPLVRFTFLDVVQKPALCQGTTSVVPQRVLKNGLQPLRDRNRHLLCHFFNTLQNFCCNSQGTGDRKTAGRAGIVSFIKVV